MRMSNTYQSPRIFCLTCFKPEQREKYKIMKVDRYFGNDLQSLLAMWILNIKHR